METLYFKELGSTQEYLKKQIADKNLSAPIAVITDKQTEGIGSRDNSWIGVDNNLFFSFALSRTTLPEDLMLQSASIYFSFLLKEILESYGSKTFLKWPNDFYIEDRKIGGTVTNLVGENIVCGIGINIIAPEKKFGKLDISIDRENLLYDYFSLIKKCPAWREIFSKYSVEFYKNRGLITHHNGGKVSLETASLNDDGSLTIDGERVLSFR